MDILVVFHSNYDVTFFRNTFKDHLLSFSRHADAKVYYFNAFMKESHHTGNIKKCIDESYRVLKPGGSLILMIYSDTFFQRSFLRLSFFYKKYIRKNILADFSTFKRQMYDVNIDGIAAPVSEFTSKNQLRTLLRKFNKYDLRLENHQMPFFRKRNLLLKPPFNYLLGCDWYISAKK